MKHTVTAQARQTLADIAIQEYGTLEALAPIIKLNPMPAHQALEAGTTVRLPDIDPAPAIRRRCQAEAVSPATALTPGMLRTFSPTFSPTFE